MKAAGKKYEPVIYDGAGHGFMRAGQAPDANDANKKAWEEGFKRMVSLLGSSGAASATPAQKPVRGGSTSASAAVAAMSCHDTTTVSDAEHGAMAGMSGMM
jgi:carboxymethylenebutenolidase